MKRQFARTLQRIAALSFGVFLTLSHVAQTADNTGAGDVAGDSAALVDSNVFTLFSTGGALTLVKTAFLTNHGLNILGVLEKPMLVSDLRHTLQKARTTLRVTTESELRKALELGQLTVHYLPKVVRHLERGWRIAGAEALARWQHPEFGLVMPDEFIPLAALADDREVIESSHSKVIAEESFGDGDVNQHILQTVNIPYLASDPTRPAALSVAADITER